MRRVSLLAAFVLMIAVMARADSTANQSLNQVLPESKIDGVSLAEAIDFLRDVSGANIHVNWKELESAGVSKDMQVTVHLRNVTLRKLLSLVLNEAGSGGLLTYYTDNNVIEITTREIADKQLITRVYDVGDLLVDVPDFDQPPTFNISTSTQTRGGGGGQSLFGGTSNNTTTATRDQRGQQLIDTIQAVIQPEVWTANGGSAVIRFFNNTLIVTAPRSVHEALGGVTD